MGAECDRLPLAPVSVTVYVPAEPEQDSVEAAEVPSVTLVPLRVQINPVEGVTVDVRVTVPVNE